MLRGPLLAFVDARRALLIDAPRHALQGEHIPVRNPGAMQSTSFYNIQLPSRSRIFGRWLIANEEKWRDTTLQIPSSVASGGTRACVWLRDSYYGT